MGLAEIREWDEDKRRARLRELGEALRILIAQEGTTELLCNKLYVPIIDELIILFLETCRTAFDGKSPLEMFSYVLMESGFKTPALGLLTIRFQDTLEVIEQYKEKTGFEKEALKEELMERGII